MIQTKIIKASTTLGLENGIKEFLHTNNHQKWQLQGGPFVIPEHSSAYPTLCQMLVLTL